MEKVLNNGLIGNNLRSSATIVKFTVSTIRSTRENASLRKDKEIIKHQSHKRTADYQSLLCKVKYTFDENFDVSSSTIYITFCCNLKFVSTFLAPNRSLGARRGLLERVHFFDPKCGSKSFVKA